MTTNSNHPAYDAMLHVASTVGTNVRTLRNNKRALACGLILAVAVEDFKWRDAWDNAKKAAKFSTMEKDEQNQFNVMGSSCRVVIDHYDQLSDEQREAIKSLTATTSTMAKAIKDGIKAKDEADKAADAPKASDAPTASNPADMAPQTPAVPADRSEAINMVAAMLRADVSATEFTADEIAALAKVIEAVDTFRANIVAQSKAA